MDPHRSLIDLLIKMLSMVPLAFCDAWENTSPMVAMHHFRNGLRSLGATDEDLQELERLALERVVAGLGGGDK